MDVKQDVLNQAWNLSPTSVFGVLVGFLLVGLLVLGLVVIVLWKTNLSLQGNFLKLLEENIKVIRAFTDRFDGDGRELEDFKLQSTIRGVVTDAMTPILNALEKLPATKPRARRTG